MKRAVEAGNIVEREAAAPMVPKRSILACLFLLAIAAGCATTRPRSHPAFVFEGSEENLVQLAQAAQGCGMTGAEITRQIPGGPLVVLIDIPARTDPRFDCTMRWIGDHPELGLFRDR